MAARHWLDSDGNWTTAADWSGGVAPGPGDTAIISKSGRYTVSEDASSIATIAVNAITIGAAGATLQITGVAGNLVGTGGISNSGTLSLAGRATLTVAGGATNRGFLFLDSASGDGGGALIVGGTLDNREFVQVGSGFSNLSAATVLTLGGLVNRASAAFLVLGSAAHLATLQFSGAGAGFTSNAGSFTLANTAPLTLNNAFANSGLFTLGGSAALTVTGDFTNSGTLDLEIGSGDGGGALTIGGTLVNTRVVQIGPNDASLSAPTTATLGGLDNRTGGNLQLFGSAKDTGTVTVTGPANNAGTIDIGDFATLDVTGGNAFTQTAGRTTLSGTLSAATIDIEGGVLAVKTADFTNSSSMVVGNGGKIDFSAGGLTNLSGTTLTGGSFEVDAKGILQLPNNATIVTLAANLTVSGTGSVVRSFDTTTKAQVAIETTLTTIAAGGALNVLGGRSYTTKNNLSDA
ncbi:MAG: beta strand repeat-containing protein, partial [Stellaceae bacterium]